AGNLRTMLHMTINSFWTHFADKEAAKGSYFGIFLWQVIVPQIVYAVTAIGIVYIACTAGADVVAAFVKNMPAWVTKGLGAVSGVLPAVGICMALNLIFKKNTAPFFFLGWVATQYMGLNGIPLTVVGCIIAYVATFGVKPNVGGAK
ncbi:MAG: PTS sugar transporter subunit IIC, partial [Stenotrophomonas sp.]